MSTRRLKRIAGAPLAVLRVVPFPENRFSLVIADVKDAVTVPTITFRDVFQADLLVVRQILGNLGITGVSEDELNVVAVMKPKVTCFWKSQVQRHTALVEHAERATDPGESPVRHFVFVTVDYKREGLLRHTRKRIRRSRRLRCNNSTPIKPNPAKQNKRTPAA